MANEYVRIKKLGKSSKYYVSGRGDFIKECKGNGKSLKKEYLNLKKFQKEVHIEGLQAIEPIEISSDGRRLISKYIDAEPLINLPRPDIYHEFGKRLKEFHEMGFTHGHLQFNDVLYQNGTFILTDLGSLNEADETLDLVKLRFSIRVFRLKRPWLWLSYTRCYNAFEKGYGMINQKKVDKEYNKWVKYILDRRINKGTFLSLFSAFAIGFAFKIGLI